MTVIHAFPRSAGFEYEYRDLGLKLMFEPNAAGHVVCDVPNEIAVERLLAVTDHFRLYEQGEPPAKLSPVLTAPPAPPPVDSTVVEPPAAAQTPPERQKYVLVHGEDRLDLNALDDAALHQFCKANAIKVHHKQKGDTVRDIIVAAMKAPE